jgi:hypothetical protein
MAAEIFAMSLRVLLVEQVSIDVLLPAEPLLLFQGERLSARNDRSAVRQTDELVWKFDGLQDPAFPAVVEFLAESSLRRRETLLIVGIESGDQGSVELPFEIVRLVSRLLGSVVIDCYRASDA